MADIKSEIKDFISAEFVTDGSDIGDDTNLLEEEIIDSLGIFTLVSFVEDKYGVKVEPEEVNLDNFETLSAIEGLVQGKLA